MQGRKLSQGGFAAPGQLHPHLPSVLPRRCARHHSFPHQPVNQTDSAVMADLQPLRQLPHGDPVTTGVAFDGQQGLMLLRGETGGFSGGFTEMQKFSQRITKRGQRFILGFAKWSGR